MLSKSHALVEFIVLPLPDFQVCRCVLVVRLDVHNISLEISKKVTGIKIEVMTGPSWSDNE